MQMKMKMDCLPLHLFCSRYATLLFLVFTISISCLPPPSRACHREPFHCGNQTFLYPFGAKNSGCGDPTLQLECDPNDMTIITVGGIQYYILNLSEDWEDHKITIVAKNQWSQRCNPLFNNYSSGIWSSLQFSIAEEYKNLTLWEGCSPEAILKDPPVASPLPCNTSWYFNLTENLSFGRMCESRVTFPVPAKSLENSTPDLLYPGLRINWNTTESCWRCSSYEGLCVYKIDPLQFDCSCGDSSECNSEYSRSKPAWSIILGCSIGGAGVLFAVIIVLVYFVRRNRTSRRGSSSEFSNYEGSGIEKGEKGYMVGSVRIFSYQELQEATNFFDKNNELGDGGFGTVYLGKVEDGRTVAVKRLYQENSRRFEQFINEVEILSSINHPNLVRLYGCTSPESPVLLLVYEFVSNGTLADHLHGSRRSLRSLPWGIRLNIALQTAQALAYLHSIEPPIFHRDVKSNNILLDEHLGVKVADFGLSRLVPANVSHVTTAPQGTPGYVDPEYHQCFHLTDKSDVYSFGVVLVELISAKVAVDIMRNRSEISLANMAMDKMRRGVLNELVDPDLKIESNPEVKAMVFAVAELAFECLSRERDFRPSMKDVVSRLEQITEMQEKSRESSKPTSFVPIASPLSAPIMGSQMTGQYWAPMSL